MLRFGFIGLFALGLAVALGGCDSASDSQAVHAQGGSANPASTGGAPGTAGTDNGGTSTTGGTTASAGTGSGIGGSLASDCGAVTGTANLVGQYDITHVTREGLDYIVQNNVWGNSSAVQKLQVNGTSYTVVSQTGNNSGSGAPVSYPSIFIGSNNSHTTASSNLPKAVTALGTVMTRFSHNADGSVPGIYNAAYDVWFSTTSAGDATTPSGGYLMVWLWDPPEKQPVGSVRWSGVTIPNVSGTWDVWLGTGAKPVISYVRTTPIASLTFDLNLFIQDAVQNRPGSIQSSWYLTNVFGGFEIWNAGAGLQVNCFSVSVT
jgi:hypothetical protein